jgi:hypothetical protein
MLFLSEDIKKLSEYLERLADFDEELLRKIRPKVQSADYTGAVREAFTVLEGRLRTIADIEGRPNVRDVLEKYIFPDDSQLIKTLPGEITASSLRNLYSGAFGVFRNPIMHRSDVEYGSAKCREILILVNLLLRLLSETQSDEARILTLLKSHKISPRIQMWCLKIVQGVLEWNNEIRVDASSYFIRLLSRDRSFALFNPIKTGLKIECFTGGRPLEGTDPIGKETNPQWRKFVVRAENDLPHAIETLKEAAELRFAVPVKRDSRDLVSWV